MRKSSASRARAWEYLREELGADLVLVQEASPPDTLSSVYRPINKDKYNWGSAVVSFRADLVLRERPRVPLADCYLTPVVGAQLPDSHPGACAVADVLDEAGKHLFTAVSLYGQWEVMPVGKMYACARVHRMLSDLTPVLAGSRRRPLVLAGDLNVTTQRVASRQGQIDADGALAVFARLRAWRLIDCVDRTRSTRERLANCTCANGDACSHVRTVRHKNRVDSPPTQLDYVFISESLSSSLRSCRVVDEAAAWELSDHCPLLVDLA